MQIVPEKIKGVSHPLVNEMYLKRNRDSLDHEEGILVIETNFPDSDDVYEHEAYDSYMINLLFDLNDLKEKARFQVGPFDRVDIRTHRRTAA